MPRVIYVSLWVLQVATNAGIRVTQPGVSVPYAADYQYVFNSDWPSLAIAFEAVIQITSGTSVTVAHSLGFFPLTMVWQLTNGVSTGRIFSPVTFDKNNIYISGSVDATISYSIKCYNLDISKSVSYELPKPPVIKTRYDPSTGIKVTKYGKSMGSTDLRDYILHSRAQSPAVLVIKTQDDGTVGGGTNSITYTNPVGYTPWVLGFISPSGNNSVYKCYAPGGNQSSPAFFQLGPKAVVWTAGITGNGSLVVLRDPLVIPTTLRVIY